MNNAHARFDLSDVHDDVFDDKLLDDKVDAIVDVATSVLRDYGSVVGGTRIERMARWIVLNLGNEPMGSQVSQAGQIARFNVVPGIDVFRIGGFVTVRYDKPPKLEPEQARILATACLRAAEKAER